MNQLNQDPWEDLVGDSSCGVTAMEEGEMDAAGNEEVERQVEGAMARAAPEAGVTDITWDPEDSYLKFTDKNSSTVQTLVAALAPVSTPVEGTMTGLEELSFKEPQD